MEFAADVQVEQESASSDSETDERQMRRRSLQAFEMVAAEQGLNVDAGLDDDEEEEEEDLDPRRRSSRTAQARRSAAERALEEELITSDEDEEEQVQQVAPVVSERERYTLGEHERAYVPLALAKERIGTVIRDMMAMKARHIDLVGEIDSNYKMVELETQEQFTEFVHKLHEEYRAREAALCKAINVYRSELLEAQNNWQQALESLETRNTLIMEENKTLLATSSMVWEGSGGSAHIYFLVCLNVSNCSFPPLAIDAGVCQARGGKGRHHLQSQHTAVQDG